MVAIYQLEKNIAKEPIRLNCYKPKELILTNKPGLWQVKSGIVQLEKIHDNGKRVIVGWVFPESYFGDWFGYKSNCNAIALSDVKLIWHSSKDIESSPFLLEKIVAKSTQRIAQSEALLAISGLRTVEERLKQLLMFLKEEIGEKTPHGTRLKMRLTHRNIADTINTSRVTVTRLLGEFQREGLLKCERHSCENILILKMV